ncbi:hypothetical protein like AT3G62730 [Hibiscus trionum]|uniref:Desiccation-related protein PCC13-62 n=1 Tax=Hibiscus trionum TaxID=183268 RepID=A0A9W7H1K9_HIBTR|nr:hypothetical protein like AT3G62730 [Hibiscus trionum]
MASRSCFYAFLLLVASQSAMIEAEAEAEIVLPPPQCRPNALVGNEIRTIIQELGLQSVGHLRAIVNTTLLNAPLARPQINMSVETFNTIVKQAFGFYQLIPAFSVYRNDESFLYAAGAVSSLLQQYLTGLIPQIIGFAEQQLVAGITVNEATGFGVLRGQLYALADERVSPFGFDTGTLVNRTANLTNQLGGCGVKDEGLVVPEELGAENRTTTNAVPADINSLAYARYEREILRIVFGTGNATKPGGLFPNGFNGTLYQQIVAGGLS